MAIRYPQLHGIDFRAQAASLEIPVFLVQGAHEARGRAVLADEWFAQLDAPDKQRIAFAQSGHKALFEEPERFHDVMTEIVLERTEGGTR
jgi:pimeloyl-ACP methyl ester carboxylesterase